ncbi:MAG: 6-carboxytetrahydropterin synthase [Cyclobacteriaceae bacterium]|nr:6-carboxytetrahydropterin synthase [Cyclobacteriaceae bacterium]
MNTIRITKEFSFEMAHALEGHDGKCANIHGHSYHLSVTVIGEPIAASGSPKLGMLIDFSDLKKIINEEVIHPYDHALMLKDTDPHVQQLKGSYTKVILTTFQPTCENMLVEMAPRIAGRMPAPLKLHSLKLRETATSYAEWYAADNSQNSSYN